MKRLIATLLLAAACTTHTVPVMLLTQTQQVPVVDTRNEDYAIIEQAMSDLGFAVELTTTARGSLQVEIVDVRKGYPGRKYASHRCYPIARCEDVPTCRHEIAHQLGLSHHPDPANVIFRHSGKDTIKVEPWQREKMWRRVEQLNLCRP